MGTKFDYYEYTNIRRLQILGLQMIKTDCELERAIKRTHLIYSHSNPRMAGFLLTNNRSMFLETNDNVAWLYRCPQYFSPLQIMDKCYDRLYPIMYLNIIHFVDPITRKTYTSAEERSCVDKHDNLFQLDIEDDNSCVELTPGITRVKGPSIFEPNIAPQRLTKYKFQDSDELYLFTDHERKKIWRGIKINNEMKDAIQTFSKELVVSQDNFKSEARTYLNYPMRAVLLILIIQREQPISIGSKVLLGNHSKSLLISKKLQSLRSGPYTVTKHITNTTYEIQGYETPQKRAVHRNHIVEYFPKEREIQSLIADYTTVYADPEQFYDNYNRHYIDKFNTTQPSNNMHYMPWPVFNNVETPPQPPKSRPTTPASTNTTTRRSSDNPPVDSGIETLGLRTIFNTQQQPH